MKWIGQHIYDLVSRFRGDVYLENISSGTIASGAHLGLDSNNKIVKATDGGGDLTAIIAGTGLSGDDLSGPIPTLNVDASQTQITSIGTIGTGTWQGTAIASAYLDSDTAHLSVAQTYSATKTFGVDTGTSIVIDGDKAATSGDGAVIHIDALTVTDNSTSTSGTAAKFTHVNIEKPRLAATNSSVTTTNAATLYIQHAPSAGTNMTLTNAYALWVDDGLVKFDGALTVDGTITGNVTGDLTGNADTVTTNANLTGHVTSSGNATTLAATQPTIESIGTDGDTLSILGDVLSMSNTTSSYPQIKLTNTTDDAAPSVLIFEKLRDDNGVASGTYLGDITFRGEDSGQNLQNYANITSQIDVGTAGEESGKLTFNVANHDGGLGSGLILTGGSENDEVDVTVGLGANSVTAISGGVSVVSGADINNPSDGGTAALIVDNDDVDQIALDVDASNTTANIIDVSAADLTTGNVVNIDCNSLTTGSAINLDIDDASTANHTKSLINIDYDKSGVTAGGSTNTTKGLNINLADAATNHAGSYVNLIGAQIDVDIANNTGAITQKGLVVNVAKDDVDDAGSTSGVEITVANGSTAGDLVIMSSADNNDKFAIKTAIAGATTLTTEDGGGNDDASLSLNAEGAITLSSEGPINLSPSSGNGIVFDATITADGGSLTGITTLGVDSVSLTAVQTSAESFVNNDTSIMTSAAIEDKIQAHYAVSYITFVGQATMLSSGNWVTTAAQGISNHSWSQDMGVNTETNNSSQGSLAKQYGHMGVRMPSACTITKLYGAIRNAGGNRQATIGLFCARATDSTLPDWGTTTATEPKLQIHADANNDSGSYANRPVHAEASVDVAMAAGDMFYPAIKLTGVTSGGDTDNVYASFTVEIKTLIV